MFRSLLCKLGFHSYIYDCILYRINHKQAEMIRCNWLCWYCKACKKVCKYCKQIKE